jgi:hypothetical protein
VSKKFKQLALYRVLERYRRHCVLGRWRFARNVASLLLIAIFETTAPGEEPVPTIETESFFGMLRGGERTMHYDAIAVLRLTCSDAPMKKFEQLSRFGLVRIAEKTEKRHVDARARWSIPNSCLYVSNQGFPSYNGGLDAIPTKEPNRRDFELRTYDGHLQTILVHVRPYIDSLKLGERGVGTPFRYPQPKDVAITKGSEDYIVKYYDSPDEEAPIPFTYIGMPPVRGSDPGGKNEVHRLTAKPIARAWVIARHYASITGDDGLAKIEYLPSNREMKFRVFHPFLAAALPGCKIGDKVLDENCCFLLTLQPGLNDLGVMDLSDAVDQYCKVLSEEMATKGLTVEQIRANVMGIEE